MILGAADQRPDHEPFLGNDHDHGDREESGGKDGVDDGDEEGCDLEGVENQAVLDQ